MSILLINPPAVKPGGLSHIDNIRRRFDSRYYYSLPIEHLGLMSIKSYARSKGLSVNDINGLTLKHYSQHQTLKVIKNVVKLKGEPRLIGFSNIAAFEETLWLSAQCKKIWPQTLIIIGNDFSTLNYERLLKNYPQFDFVCLGEGERVFTSLAIAVLNSSHFGDIPGLAWRTSDGNISFKSPEAMNMDELPWVDRCELPLVQELGFAPAIFTTRGCPYRCTFCGTGATSSYYAKNGYRERKIEDIVDEIEYLQRDYAIDFLNICDDLFVDRNEASILRAENFARELIRRRVGIRFMVSIRIDSVQEDLFALLREAGLQRVFVGIESGSRDQLRIYRKYYNSKIKPLDQIRVLRNLDLNVIPGIITFHPWITPQELRKTLQMIDETGYKGLNVFTQRSIAYPGTDLYLQYRKLGILKNDWPIGEWEFLDPNARILYNRVRQMVISGEVPSFDDARRLFIKWLEEWERENMSFLASGYDSRFDFNRAYQ